MFKICSKCKEIKSLSEFCSDKKNRDGLQSQCKTCKISSVIKSRKKYYNNYKNYDKKYRKTEKYKEKNRKSYYKNRIARNMSRSMRKCLKKDKNGMSWELLVNYSLEELKIHLEKRFKEGMSWENYGKWHIDHIKPVSSFNITSIYCDDFKECWSLDNLQPLWASENIKKSNIF